MRKIQKQSRKQLESESQRSTIYLCNHGNGKTIEREESRLNIKRRNRLLLLLLAAIAVFALTQALAEGGQEVAETAESAATAANPYINSFWALVPAIIAIALALLTKEVYASLFLGIVSGALLLKNFNVEATMNRTFSEGFVTSVTDGYNMGILVFLVLLGMMVALMNKAGGSAAFGRWTQAHIKTRVGAQIATIIMGILIFIDDYFNCLTVGSVMRPVTDKHNISRAKLAYLIDATAAPVCIIAPISSWAAAVAAFADDGVGFKLFIDAIPYNFYAILTLVMMFSMVLMKTDYGPMKRYERNAVEKGDLFSGENPYAAMETEGTEKGKKESLLYLLLPVIALIVFCTLGMLYTGKFFSGEDFITAFSNSDASIGLMLGSFFAILFTVIYYLCSGALSFKSMMECLPEGFKAMVPAILILVFAWTLKDITIELGAKEYVREIVMGSAAGLQRFLPAIVFLIACLLSFATGSSWGTFGMLIPIVQSVFQMSNPLAIVCVSACMAGAVCGDHCSPISDTTIMSSAGAQCDHVNHVRTQLPYAMTCAGISFLVYILAGFVPEWKIVTPIGVAFMILFVFCIRMAGRRKA